MRIKISQLKKIIRESISSTLNETPFEDPEDLKVSPGLKSFPSAAKRVPPLETWVNFYGGTKVRWNIIFAAHEIEYISSRGRLNVAQYKNKIDAAVKESKFDTFIRDAMYVRDNLKEDCLNVVMCVSATAIEEPHLDPESVAHDVGHAIIDAPGKHLRANFFEDVLNNSGMQDKLFDAFVADHDFFLSGPDKEELRLSPKDELVTSGVKKVFSHGYYGNVGDLFLLQALDSRNKLPASVSSLNFVKGDPQDLVYDIIPLYIAYGDRYEFKRLTGERQTIKLFGERKYIVAVPKSKSLPALNAVMKEFIGSLQDWVANVMEDLVGKVIVQQV